VPSAIFAGIPTYVLAFTRLSSKMELDVGSVRGGHLKTAAEYMAQAFKFERMANTAPHPVFKKRYAALADCYRMLATEREAIKRQAEQAQPMQQQQTRKKH
jgi:hypothetical protein